MPLEDDGDIPAGLLGPLQVRPPHTRPPRRRLAPYRSMYFRGICRMVWRPVVQCRRRVDRLELRRAPCRVLRGILQVVQKPRDHLGP